MNKLKAQKLIAVNMAIDCINAEFKAFKKTINANHSYAASLTKRHKLDYMRQIDTFFAWDNIQGYQIRITAFHGYYGQVEKNYFYLPIHSDISWMFKLACEYFHQNYDSAYAQAERSFTGCSGA